MVKRLQRVKPKQTSEAPAKSARLPDVPEQVPGWLSTLLAKYGESEGRLVGLEQESVEEEQLGPPPPTSEEAGGLSNLLEQMAETGIDPTIGEDSYSSVEWGAPAASSSAQDAAPLDDFLANMDVTQPEAEPQTFDDDIPDWLTESAPDIPPQPDEQPAPPPPATGGEVPDWLNEALDEPADTTTPPVPASPPAAAESAISDDEVPDWLTEALDEPPDESAPDTTPTSPEISESDVPDWLSDAPQPSAPAESTPPVQQHDDVPDWLGGAEPAPDTPDTTAFSESAPVDEMDWDVPDWITEGMDDLDTAAQPPETPAAEPAPVETDVPDWLADDAPPQTEAADETPDWLASEPPPQPGAEEGDDVPDWLADETLPTELVDDVPDWLAGETPPQPGLEDGDVPDWLADDAPPPPETQAGATGWPAEAPPAQPAAETDVPDWLAEDVPSQPEASSDVPDWLADPETSTRPDDEESGPAEDNSLDWLFDTSDMPGAATETEPSSAEQPDDFFSTEPPPSDVDVPPWLDQLQSATAVAAAASTAVPAWLQSLETTSEAPLPVPGQLPPWLEQLEFDPDAVAAPLEPEVDESTAQSALEAGMAAGIAATVEGQEKVEEAQPSPKLKRLKPLKRLEPKKKSAEQPEIPEWISDLTPGAAKTGLEDTTLPEWAADLVPPDAATAEQVDPTLPDWADDLVPPDAQKPETPPPSPPDEPAVKPELRMPPGLSMTPRAAEEPTPPEEPARPAETAAQPDEEAAPDSMDWLAGLRAEASEPAEESFTSPEAEEPMPEVEIPDWLAGKEVPAEAQEPVEGEAGSEPELEFPSWLSDQTPPAEISEETIVSPASESELELPDWLAEQAPEPEEAAPVEPEIEGELPDWLSELPEAEPEAEVEPETEVEMPDWLSQEMASEAPAEPEAVEEPEPESDLPDWLAEQAPEPEEAAPVEPEIEGELPDWLSELPEAEPEAEVEPETEVEMPDWLSQEMASEAPAEPEAVEEPEPESEIPDWLAEQAPEPEEAAPVEPEIEGELPDWLSELSQAEPEAEAEPQEEVPDWLAELPIQSEEIPDLQQGVPPETSLDFLTDEPKPTTSELFWEEFESEEPPLPPWLADSEDEAGSTAAEQKSPSKPAETHPQSISELRGRRTGLTGLLSRAYEEPAPDTEGTSTGEPAEPSESEQSDEDSDDPELSERPASTGDPPLAEIPSSEMPGQVVETRHPGEADESTSSAETLLHDPSTSDSVEPPASPETPETGETPPPAASSDAAEKPAGWMQALKPSNAVETAVGVEEAPSTESTGMLAGLTGLLPAEKMVTTVPPGEQKTGNSQSKDAVLEAARNFYAIATQSPQPATVPAPVARPGRKQLMGNVVRAGLFLVFMLLVALPLLPNFQKVADPAADLRAPWAEPGGELSEVLSRRRSQLIGNELGLIDLQQPGAVALVSFDYSTGTQGEMQPLAEAILGRLRGQGMRVIVTSLEPEGAALAQQVLDKREETYGENVVNLGYLPGQITAIRELATGRKSLSAIADYQNGLTIEQRENWQDVDNLNQVDVIVTLADNPATARWWIEQMSMAAPPDTGKRYLLAATSAVTEPFLRPYRDPSHLLNDSQTLPDQADVPLDGLISGINGAAAIEAGRQQFGPARQMLDSQSIAHLLIVILIAAGTIAGWMPKITTESIASRPDSEET